MSEKFTSLLGGLAFLAILFGLLSLGLETGALLRVELERRLRVPELESIEDPHPKIPVTLLDRSGRPLAKLEPRGGRQVGLESIPWHVIDAFVAIEDNRFFEHRGVDWYRFAGALEANLRARGVQQGFSTITMQLARNLFPDEIPPAERTVRRKLVEVRAAWAIEQRWDKQEILELYLNRIAFGRGVRGIAEAAWYYFGRPVQRLSVAQGALLAAMIKAPSHYDPLRNPAAALQRRNLVLSEMERHGRIWPDAARAARNEPLGVLRTRRRTIPEAPYFVAEVRRRLEAEIEPSVLDSGLRVWTTLDRSTQQRAERELVAHLRRIETSAPSEGAEARPQGAVVVLDARDGDVLAWVGGRDFRESQFDRLSRGRRQAGSAFKPFVYAAALAQGFPLTHRLSDQPLQITLPDGELWQPANYGDFSEEDVTLREALVRSKNVATVRLARQAGYSEVARLARQAGLVNQIALYDSMPLGTLAVSPLELTAAYSMFPTLGMRVEPRLITRIENEDGRVIWSSSPRRTRVLDPAVAFLMVDVLRGVVHRGTGSRARPAGFAGPVGGKTGTTNDSTDAWFIGFTPEILAGVWIGFDRPRSLGEKATGGRLAAPLWGRILAGIYEGREPPAPWPMPESVLQRRIEPGTGLALADGCDPVVGRAEEELFVAGTEPPKYCPGDSLIRDALRRRVIESVIGSGEFALDGPPSAGPPWPSGSR